MQRPFSVVVGALILRVLVAVPPVSAQCLATSDTTEMKAQIKQTLTNIDSVSLAAKGLPYAPSTIATVTTTAVCDSVINAYNGHFGPTDPERVTSGFVFRIGTTAYGFVPSSTPLPGAAYHFFNNSFVLKANFVSLD